jgi:hypothetical protein
VFVRTDLPLAQQLAQSNHGSLQAGLLAGQSRQYMQTPSIIILQVKNEAQLLKARAAIQEQGIVSEIFYEPDSHLGYEPSFTAFATLPITEDQRIHLRKYRLWRNPYEQLAQAA